MNKTAHDIVQLARAKDRWTSLDFFETIFEGFQEFHGDRLFGDDEAIVGGVAKLAGKPVTVIGIQKGRDLQENIRRNFGSPHPEGYRKALRLMKQAEKFNRPVITLINTAGAYCGIGAEERGEGEAIARNLLEMSDLKVPIISIIIGEGGSGGALALALADEVWMLEQTIYAVLSPEGFASILWKDGSRAAEAAELMKVAAGELLELDTNDKLVLRMDADDFKKCLDINLTGTFNMTQHVLKKMMKKREGAIINLSSVSGLIGNLGQANYAASKAGVVGFTKSVAREVATRGITCNVIAPGFVTTDMTDVLSEKVREQAEKQIPMQRFGQVEDIAEAALFLAKSSYITGQVINVDGGLVMHG